MKIKNLILVHKKKTVILMASLAAVLVAACAAVFFFLWRNKAAAFSFSQDDFLPEGLDATENMISASGITSVGMTQERFEVEGLTDGLLVEEVCVSSGEELSAGDKIVKFSEESVNAAREKLEKALREAELAYRAGVIECEQTKITAEYDRDKAALEGEQAESVYNETVKSLSASLKQAQEQLDEALEEIAKYQEIVDGGDYKKTCRVEEYQALYDDNLKLLTTRMSEWGATWPQVTSGAGQSNLAQAGDARQNSSGQNGIMTASVSGSDAAAFGAGATSDQLSVLQSLYRVLEQNLKDYEQAQEDYEDAAANAELKLQTLELGLSSLNKALTEAQEDYDTQVLQAKLTMEKSLAAAERADRNFETALEKAESDLEDLKQEKKDAEENLALFESCVRDGYYTALDSGTVLHVLIDEEQYLKSDGEILLYSDLDKMTVTVSVDQGDISSIAVGDEAYVMTESGNFQGTVTQIDPVSRSDSRTNVTYTVLAELSGDIGELETNQTVTVIFWAGGDTDEETN